MTFFINNDKINMWRKIISLNLRGYIKFDVTKSAGDYSFVIFHTNASHFCQPILNHVTYFWVRIVYITIEVNIKLLVTTGSHQLLIYFQLVGLLNTKSLYTMAGVRRKNINYCSGESQ